MKCKNCLEKYNLIYNFILFFMTLDKNNSSNYLTGRLYKKEQHFGLEVVKAPLCSPASCKLWLFGAELVVYSGFFELLF